MSSSCASRDASIYDGRNTRYGNSFHLRLAEDSIRWAELQLRQNVLDLCCGTGLVVSPAERAVRPHGRITRVDISSKMPDAARSKAAKWALR